VAPGATRGEPPAAASASRTLHGLMRKSADPDAPWNVYYCRHGQLDRDGFCTLRR